MQCILYKIYFWKVFHMYYNLICIFIRTPICTKFYSCKKWVLHKVLISNPEYKGKGRTELTSLNLTLRVQ
jgi:hypothetical protein